MQRAAVQQTDQEFQDLFKDLKDVQMAVQRELAKSSGQENDNFDEQDEQIILDEYLSDDDEATDALGQDEEAEDDYSIRVK